MTKKRKVNPATFAKRLEKYITHTHGTKADAAHYWDIHPGIVSDTCRGTRHSRDIAEIAGYKIETVHVYVPIEDKEQLF